MWWVEGSGISRGASHELRAVGREHQSAVRVGHILESEGLLGFGVLGLVGFIECIVFIGFIWLIVFIGLIGV